MKYNEFGEVISVNGIMTGCHLGSPMQDAAAEKPSDNEAYATELNTVTRLPNCEDTWENQPTPIGGGGGDIFYVDFTCDENFNLSYNVPFMDIATAVNEGRIVAARQKSLFEYDEFSTPNPNHFFGFAGALSCVENNSVKTYSIQFHNIDLTPKQSDMGELIIQTITISSDGTCNISLGILEMPIMTR